MPNQNIKQDLEKLNDPLVWLIQNLWTPLQSSLGSASGILPNCIKPQVLYAKGKAWVDLELQRSTKKELILTAIVILLLTILVWNSVANFIRRLRKLSLLDIISSLPILKGKLDKEVEKARAEFKTTLEVVDPKFYKRIPEKGWADKNILKRLDVLSKVELDLKADGRYSGAVFSTKQELMDLSKEVVSKFLYTNVLFYDSHPGSRQMENEIAAMVLDMFDGIEMKCSSLVTSGGSESILLALLAHKRFYRQKKGITKPHVIMSETAHAAFYKACEFFDIETTVLIIDPVTFTVSPEQYRKAITKNTICLVGSAPSVAYGNFDPLLALDQLAGEHDIGFFCDGCMGSFLLAYIQDLKLRIDGHDSQDKKTPVDKSIGSHVSFKHLRNMSTMTCDPHKYGLSPKGCGVLMFGNPEMQKALYFGLTDWCGYLYATSLFSGSRSSALTSATWAYLMKFGREGYREVAEQIVGATRKLKDAINSIEGLKVVGNPQIGNLGCVSIDKNLNIYELGNYVALNGWKMPGIPKYPGLHLTIIPNNISKIDELIKLLKKGAPEVRANPGKYSEGACKLLTEIEKLPGSITRKVLEECYHEVFDYKNYVEYETKHKLEQEKAEKGKKK